MGKRKRLIKERKQRQRNNSAVEHIKRDRESRIKKFNKFVFDFIVKEAQRQESYRWN